MNDEFGKAEQPPSAPATTGDAVRVTSHSDTCHKVSIVAGNQTIAVGLEWETRAEADWYAEQTRRVIAKISAPSPMEAHAAEAMTASGDAEIVATLSNGCTLYRQCNEVGGYRYTSDEIGGGVVVWDTSLVNETTLRKALEVECREAGKTNPVLPGDKLPLTSGDAEADAVIVMDRAAKLLEKSAEPFDSACRILRDFVHAFTVRRLGNPLGGDPYAQKMTGGDAERRVVEAAKVYVKAIRDTGIDDEEQSRRYGILEEAVDALAQPTPAPSQDAEQTPVKGGAHRTAEDRPVRAGDVVKHLPSGETWMVAGVYSNGDILCAGWPCSLARKGDYEVLRRATDAEYKDMILKCAAMKPDSGYDPRKALAQEEISKVTNPRSQQTSTTPAPESPEAKKEGA